MYNFNLIHQTVSMTEKVFRISTRLSKRKQVKKITATKMSRNQSQPVISKTAKYSEFKLKSEIAMKGKKIICLEMKIVINLNDEKCFVSRFTIFFI